MDFLIIYAVCAMLVALLANKVFTSNALNELHKSGVENVATENPVLLHCTMFCIHLLISPIMAVVLLSTDRTMRMQASLVDTLAKD